ncbi:MAG: RMD1 family protein [Trichocoleus desertorum ATA4-8-CV12]|jgi:uncharacterized Rmd1/YagE family protein|nr:RMD1 family protein [Trichocoleus desertorum ATA4-8-CV12]
MQKIFTAPEPATLFASRTTISVQALFLGERIDIKVLETGDRLAVLPLVVTAGAQGCAVLFRYGAVVLFNLNSEETDAFLTSLKSSVIEPFEKPETESDQIQLNPADASKVKDGIILLSEFTVERLQLVADVLAKSVVLSHYEASIANFFDRIEPLAADLQYQGRGKRQDRELLRHIGGTLLIQHKMVGLVALGEKPETLWERPELERLYLRMEDEYEISERHAALQRKLELISRTAETVLDLLQRNSSQRVEWYIVILIVVEILLTLYELFFRG